ncbi:MAG: dihydropteroate synthase [Dehalococcoidia bacterium]|nr:dihydropteroate synthase [Dehalococcoidia bacterium]
MTFARPRPLALRGRTFAWGARTYIMAILNATPDSFSGDGVDSPAAAAALAQRVAADGADLVDIGAESTRPGASPLSPRDEIRRLLPVLEAVRAATDIPLSVDTYHAKVAHAALRAGADAVNDVTGLRGDPAMAAAVAEAGAALFAMHNQRGQPHASDIIQAIQTGWKTRLDVARAAGIDSERVVLDPGFGFGWAPLQNLEMVRRLPELAGTGRPVLLGPSRKSTIGLVLDSPVEARLEGTAAIAALAVAGGVDILRVHDVRAIARVARVADAVVRGNWRPPDAS